MSYEYVSVSDIAKETNLSREGIYFYKDMGLIKPEITAKAVSLYRKDVIDRVKKIQELSKTMKLAGIKEMIDKGEL